MGVIESPSPICGTTVGIKSICILIMDSYLLLTRNDESSRADSSGLNCAILLLIQICVCLCGCLWVEFVSVDYDRT